MATGSRQVTFGEFISEFQAVLTRHAPLLLIAGVALGVANTLLTYLLSDNGGRGTSGIIGLVIGYFLLKELLSREGLIRNAGGFWPYFGAGLLTGLGVIVGLILLIVPGIYFAARWSLAPAIVLGQGQGVTDSMRTSWAATEGNVWAIILFGLIIFGIYFVAAIVIGFLLGFGGLAGSFVQTLVTEFIGAIGSILGAASIVAIYRRLVGGTAEFEELFA